MPPLYCVSMCEPRGLGSGWGPSAPKVLGLSLVVVPSASGMPGSPVLDPKATLRNQQGGNGRSGSIWVTPSALLTASFTSASRFHKAAAEAARGADPLGQGQARLPIALETTLRSHVFWGPLCVDRDGTFPWVWGGGGQRQRPRRES